MSVCLADRSSNTRKQVLSKQQQRGRLALWALDGTCEGGRHVKVPAQRNQRGETASWGRQDPTDGTLTDRRGQGCWCLSALWRGHFPGSLRFLSITYQPGQSGSEIKQLLWAWGLWTQQGENSLRSLLSLNLKRCINPGKVKITAWVTLVRASEGKRNVITAGFSMFPLRGQEKTWKLLKSYSQELVF